MDCSNVNHVLIKNVHAFYKKGSMIKCTYLNNIRREASIHFRNKMKEYLKAKIDVIETNS